MLSSFALTLARGAAGGVPLEVYMKAHTSHDLPRRRAYALVAAPLLLSALGCSAESEQLGAISQAITEQTYKDASELIEMRLTTCDWVSGSDRNEAICMKPAGFVMVGGGAEIQNQASNGALLKASAPYQDNVNGWVARSTGPTHNLRAYVISMKVAGLTEAQLLPSVNGYAINEYYNGTAYVTQDQESGYDDRFVIGAGTIVLDGDNGPNPGDQFWGDAYLIEARVLSDLETTRHTVKYQSGLGSLKAYTIAMRHCPVSWNKCFTKRYREVDGASASGYGVATDTTPYPWAMASIGGWALTGGTNRRYLADLIPLNGSSPGFTVRSKNFGGADSGFTRGTSVNVMVSGAPWSFNSLTFNSGGMLFKGTSTVQSAPGPFTDNHKWSLEKISGSSNYLLRSGNPGTGGQCARWTSGSENVTLSSTCSGTSREWQVKWGDVATTFQLRNVGAGSSPEKCLDRNGVGFGSTGDVKLKTCSNGSAQQQVFLDAYSWP
jgi:hypothetical protein